ncbi:MAG: class I SAM-dependent methyltransferase [Bryobacterales bacterium]|nr:class I SAM-dependent methyltransferase [Bryobacterales bacterium]
MENLFATASLSTGYATSRPPVHPRVIERMRRRLPDSKQFARVLDVGCGAGLSTKPLRTISGHCVGIDPVEAMLHLTRHTTEHADFVTGHAEALPFQTASFDLIAAAGSLNYVDLNEFFPQAHRILSSTGALAVYDFSPGRRFRGNSALSEWYSEFETRYPTAQDGALPLSPERLSELATGFTLEWHERFEIGIPLDPQFYENYMMTETSVAYAVKQGTPEGEIRDWCRSTLVPVFQGQSCEVLFDGYIAWLAPKS